jgi:hypothetical protein
VGYLQLYSSPTAIKMKTHIMCLKSKVDVRIRKKRWLRDARGEREPAHHARHAKHASYEKCPSTTPMRNAYGVCTACARRAHGVRKQAEVRT